MNLTFQIKLPPINKELSCQLILINQSLFEFDPGGWMLALE